MRPMSNAEWEIYYIIYSFLETTFGIVLPEVFIFLFPNSPSKGCEIFDAAFVAFFNEQIKIKF